MIDALRRLLSAERHVIVQDVVLPCSFASIVHLDPAHGPLVLLDRAAPGSPYAARALAALDPRFTLEATRTNPPAHEAIVMPWDDSRRPKTTVVRARRTLRFASEVYEDDGSPFDLVEDLLRAAEGSVPHGLDKIPFLSGFIGYFGYGAADFVETLKPMARPREAAPDAALLFADTVLTTRDANGTRATLAVVGRGFTAHDAASDAELRATTAMDLLFRIRHDAPPRATRATTVRSAHSAKGYQALVARAKEHLVAGDAFQLCLTHRVTIDPPPPSPAHLYGALRARNPAPFASFARLGEVTIVSSSPERFLLVEGGQVEARPIKGTRPRGQTPEADRALREDLTASEKDGAENDMIVDLLRNDLAKVSVPGTVVVRERRIVEAHPSVHQLVSTIVSRLLPGKGPVDLLRAAFPGGSMTGAPKVSAIDLLAELEPHERGVYSGALGYLDPRGVMDTAIVIRAFVFTREGCTFGVGGGIVLDSDPEAEWRETLDKGNALVKALQDTLGQDVVWSHAGADEHLEGGS